MKIKIGTQLEEKIYLDLKVAAARERRAIGELIQDAIATYIQQQSQPRGKKSGLARLLESPHMQISDQQFLETMEADFWDQ
jgi:hypothetical protein